MSAPPCRPVPRAFALGAAAALLLAGTVQLAAPAGAAPAAPRALTPKVLVIGIDGAVLSRVKAADAPRLKGLMAQGTTAESLLYAGPMAATSSGPGWSTVATGVWPDRHGVKDNSFTGKQFGTHPDWLTRVENAKPQLSTYAAADWEPIASAEQNGPIYSAKVDKRYSLRGDADGYGVQDPKIASAAAAELRASAADASFVYFGEIDVAGHGSGAASQAYLDAVARTDRHIGTVLDAVAARPTYGQEDWRILVTTDHGHTAAGGHGGSTPEERGTFVLARGAGIAAGAVRHDVRLVDVAATALDHLGVSTAGLDGVPLGMPRAEAFDTLRPRLQARTDETQIPAGLKGHTRTAPAGWAVDNSAMGGGGVAEWRGWAFATDDFWTRSQRDQWRELNVRSRDVFAVADSDEWADKATTGTFDSTLVSPTWQVAGGTSRTLRFQTHYRHEAGQTAQVLVSYDGGAPRVVRTLTADAVARTESVALDVPAGATGIQVRFRYTGTNNWFWTVDDVQVV
ncbi:alkaline phosphatase family protein [Streptomyces genisteinicus]|uniref:Alkaline phosphatase family protein n=1 Tax=Streptomyces genisteinicus TaxID=2768068 RepID=A0A7H0I0M2_9ACTN|nr:alkaline phosphatase family protein [Streptomyces genisteinicus]QNP66338.1 alkaline phosphatase family protein [Streptomyces genisteinicus]